MLGYSMKLIFAFLIRFKKKKNHKIRNFYKHTNNIIIINVWLLDYYIKLV